MKSRAKVASCLDVMFRWFLYGRPTLTRLPWHSFHNEQSVHRAFNEATEYFIISLFSCICIFLRTAGRGEGVT